MPCNWQKEKEKEDDEFSVVSYWLTFTPFSSHVFVFHIKDALYSCLLRTDNLCSFSTLILVRCTFFFFYILIFLISSWALMSLISHLIQFFLGRGTEEIWCLAWFCCWLSTFDQLGFLSFICPWIAQIKPKTLFIGLFASTSKTSGPPSSRVNDNILPRACGKIYFGPHLCTSSEPIECQYFSRCPQILERLLKSLKMLVLSSKVLQPITVLKINLLHYIC